jgi:hypothetical protein
MSHAVEVTFQSIDVRRPEPAELSQPGIDLAKWFRLQPVETALCVHRGLHETGIAQHPQMLGHGRLRHTKLTLDLSHRLLRRDQKTQYRAAVRLRNDFESFHFLDILQRAYTCQGIYEQGPGHRTAAAFLATSNVGCLYAGDLASEPRSSSRSRFSIRVGSECTA